MNHLITKYQLKTHYKVKHAQTTILIIATSAEDTKIMTKGSVTSPWQPLSSSQPEECKLLLSTHTHTHTSPY